MNTLIAGVGSPILGDDGVGIHAIRRLVAGGLPPGVDAVEVGTGGLALLDHVRGYRRLIVIDAIVSGAPAGTVHVLEGEQVAHAVHLGAEHGADLPTALDLGRRLLQRDMPEEVVVVAIEAGSLARFSETLSPAVEAALGGALATATELAS
jgi:hydrogenase maturation protease